MGWFEKKEYVKTSNGKWLCVKCGLEKAPHEVGRWEQSNKLERNSSLGERTYIDSASTKSGINQKVVKASTYFPDNTKTVRTLITTSNKLPQKYAEIYNKKNKRK